MRNEYVREALETLDSEIEELQRLGVEASRQDCTRFAPTAEAVGLSLLVAVWLPALVAYFGWRLGQSPAATQYTRCIAYGLVVSAGVWATLRVPRELLRPQGVAEAHCGWSESAVRALFRDLRWLKARYELQVDGRAVKAGSLKLPAVGPRASETITVSVSPRRW